MAFKPTNHVCITEIGKKRKLDRMIASELKKRYPLIYEELEIEASLYIDFDQNNPFSTVVNANPPEKKRSRTMEAVRQFKQQQARQAIAEKFVPKFYGLISVEVKNNV